MIRLEKIYKTFGDLQVLKNINLEVKHGEVIVILGPSGSGKTTMLRSINALEIPETGRISIDETSLNFEENPSNRDIIKLRNKTAMVFQNFNLFPHLNVLENITEGLTVVKKIPKEKAVQKAKVLLKKVGLSDKLNEFPAMLSGGQQQRVAIARSLAMEPEVILFDEPTSALDIELVEGILKLMQKLAGEGMTMIVVTHEITFAENVADRIIFINEGEILDDIKPSTLHSGIHSKRFTDFLNQIEHDLN